MKSTIVSRSVSKRRHVERRQVALASVMGFVCLFPFVMGRRLVGGGENLGGRPSSLFAETIARVREVLGFGFNA